MNNDANSGDYRGGTRDDTARAGEPTVLRPPGEPASVARGSARPSTIIAALLAVIGTLAVVWFAVSQTMGIGGAAGADADEEPLAEDIVADRPECPEPAPGVTGTGPLAGVMLPCLGAAQQGTIDVGAALAGTPAVVNVWSWNCAPCRDELPILEEWAAANPDVRVVGVQAATSQSRGSALLEELGLTSFVSYHDGFDAVGPALELPRVVPITVVLRADGTVADILPRAFESVADFDTAVRGALA